MMRILDSTASNFEAELNRYRQRSGAIPPETIAAVETILSRVQREGDRAVFELTDQFDGVTLDESSVALSNEEIKAFESRTDRDAIQSLQFAADRIRVFHEKQKEKSWTMEDGGGTLGQIVRPLKRVGIYVPGGKAAYPSSVLMNAIPAKVAGVQEVIMVSPAPKGEMSPSVAAAARIAGVDRIFRVGGAQAVAALAYGTESIPQVDKIVGPGNIYVALAKKLVFGTVDIDMVAGPSEILVIADHTAEPDFIAADLLSQAEHDELAWTILVTTSRSLLQEVEKSLHKQLESLARKNIATRALKNYGTLIHVKDLTEAARVSNAIGPEHLEVMTEKPAALVDLLENAGAIFLGSYSAEPIGDYVAGPNHVLPTGGTSRFFSPLHVGDFYKRSSLISLTQQGFRTVADHAIRIAELEGLPGHARSVKIRRDAIEREERGT